VTFPFGRQNRLLSVMSLASSSAGPLARFSRPTPPICRLDPSAGLARQPDPGHVMQAEPRQASLLELADRRLIDACQGLHFSLRQARPTTPFVRFAAHPNQLIGDIGLERSHLSVHGSIQPDTACLTAN
jgi:hypothetical protein